LKRKPLVLSGLLILFLFQIIHSASSPTLIVSASGFLIEVEEGLGLGFQGDNSLSIDVTSGLLNGSSCSLSLYDRRGSLAFWARNNSILEITSPDAEEGFDLSVSGANNTTQSSKFIWEVGINTGNNVTIIWTWRIESWIGKYTMIALGFSGIGLMVFSPTWVAFMIRKKGLDADSFERMMYAMLIFCVGFGLLVMWLWA